MLLGTIACAPKIVASVASTGSAASVTIGRPTTVNKPNRRISIVFFMCFPLFIPLLPTAYFVKVDTA
ncbi:hypothetical protein EFM7_1373 [Enterococcus faecalis M7]|nr:hypothetical protein OG1X_2344 [Enterococcus faecalis OG1X]ELA05386.1 hypothetical protein EFM7_1373 [Enterococcus faecalis M7]